jgi:hypothetical protein
MALRRCSITLPHSLIFTIAAMAQPNCSYDAATLLALTFEQFDQDLTGGWRALERKGCSAAAAEVLRRYRTEHQPLTDGKRSLLLWHEGQVLAFMGDNQRAIPLMLAGVPVDDTSGFADYALGTVAFVLRDKPALLAARTRLAGIPKPADWTDKMTVIVNGKQVSVSIAWPPNLNVLDGLIMCFDRPYSKAYFCRPLKLKARTHFLAPPAVPIRQRRKVANFRATPSTHYEFDRMDNGDAEARAGRRGQRGA